MSKNMRPECVRCPLEYECAGSYDGPYMFGSGHPDDYGDNWTETLFGAPSGIALPGLMIVGQKGDSENAERRYDRSGSCPGVGGQI